MCFTTHKNITKKKKEYISPSMSFTCFRTNSMFWNKNGVRGSFGFPIIACLHRLIAFAGRSTGDSYGKESFCNAGDPGSLPESGRYPGEGNGYPL